MASLNKVFLIGNLTRPPELRYTPTSTAVASFGLATNRNFTTQAGEKKQETCFVRIVVWGKQAEACNKYITKGSSVFVEGRLIYRNWEGKDGQKKSTLEVRADRVQFLNKVSREGAAPPVDAAQEPPAANALPDFEEDFSDVAQDERDLT